MNEVRTSVENYDLRRHAVIEASAGTGKTHTIEQLVRRLLTEEAIPIEQILVVTFTEKATGELKTRLRRMLERALQQDDGNDAVLRTSLENFDQAPIFTIHGFCQRILQEYAFEQGQDFHAELVNDIDLMKLLLHEIQRKHWRAHFGDRLKSVLEKANYNRETAEIWERKVLDIATRFKPRDHQLRPPCAADWWQRLEEADFTWAGQLEIFTIDALHKLLCDHKKQRGLQSFDDMIAAVEESLDPEKNPDADTCLTALRTRYRCGIVDEFQDTDPLQWRIFRRIFLAGGTSKLFIVGDPKQAIYAFRGSDLPTYLHAAKEMTKLHDACEYPLDQNWRSEQDLLDALNCLFGDGEWFPRASGIQYHPVHAPDADLRATRVEKDVTNRAALTIVDLSLYDRLKVAHKQYVRFVAHEIQRLLTGDGSQPALSFGHKTNPVRPIHAGDIGVLVMKRAEAEPLTQAFDRAGIPYSFYKQTGLWQTDEAMHLEVLLQTLARPDDRSALRKALLTCFFRVKPNELLRTSDVPALHSTRQLFQAWIGHAENRQWSALCRSLLEDTGLLFLTPVGGDNGPMRTFVANIATLQHLLAAVAQAGHGRNLDLSGILEWIRDLRAQRETGEADLVPIEAERSKVQIMTIHAAKGLEFPIVFLAGGFTQRSGIAGPILYRDEQDRVVFDLSPNEEACMRVKEEQLSEQRRLLYVALTRPMLKLYVPKVKLTTRSRQHAGPVGTVLLPALDQSCPDKLGPLIAEVVTPPLAISAAAMPSKPDPATAFVAKSTFTLDGPLFPAMDGQLGRRRIVVRSFSSMARHHLSHVGEGASFGDQPAPIEDEVASPADHEDPLRGPVFGDMVHKVLQVIDFAEVARAGVPEDLCRVGTHARRILDKVIKADVAQLRTRTPLAQLEEAARRQIAHLVWHSLNTPLSAVGCRLGELARKDRLHEVEFLFPERTGSSDPRKTRPEEGFVTGYMDLLFRRGDRYFLLDWKTNLLPGYGREQLERSMMESDYHRQYRLYLHAAQRWLRRVHGPKFDFLEHFGGVYYLYVRGMNGRDESTGVFFHSATPRDLDLPSVLTGF